MTFPSLERKTLRPESLEAHACFQGAHCVELMPGLEQVQATFEQAAAKVNGEAVAREKRYETSLDRVRDLLPSAESKVAQVNERIDNGPPQFLVPAIGLVTDTSMAAAEVTPKICDPMLSCIAGAVDTSYALHNRTNGSTVSLIYGNMAGEKLFTVSIYPDRAKEFWERPSWQELFEFAKANLDLLLKPGHALGTWFNDWECVHVANIVVTIPDRDAALELGVRFNQLAIFDLEARLEIPISHRSQESVAEFAEAVND